MHQQALPPSIALSSVWRSFAAQSAPKSKSKSASDANFQQPTPWSFPCTAGETTAVIDYNGDVRACELREKFASLVDFDFDFNALWTASERQAELTAIDGGKACWCTHVCFIHDSMRHARGALLYEAPKNYLTRRSW